MKLILTDDAGTLLDCTEVTPEEWLRAVARPEIARLLLEELTPGDAALNQVSRQEQP